MFSVRCCMIPSYIPIPGILTQTVSSVPSATPTRKNTVLLVMVDGEPASKGANTNSELIPLHSRCPATDFAEESMFILFALFLWGLEIRPKKDENGNDIKPDGKYQHRIIP